MFYRDKKQIFQTGFYHRIIKRNKTNKDKSREENNMSIFDNIKGKVKQEMAQREQMKTLENRICQQVQKLSHIRYNGGFLVKMFC